MKLHAQYRAWPTPRPRTKEACSLEKGAKCSSETEDDEETLRLKQTASGGAFETPLAPDDRFLSCLTFNGHTYLKADPPGEPGGHVSIRAALWKSKPGATSLVLHTSKPWGGMSQTKVCDRPRLPLAGVHACCASAAHLARAARLCRVDRGTHDSTQAIAAPRAQV